MPAGQKRPVGDFPNAVFKQPLPLIQSRDVGPDSSAVFEKVNGGLRGHGVNATIPLSHHGANDCSGVVARGVVHEVQHLNVGIVKGVVREHRNAVFPHQNIDARTRQPQRLRHRHHAAQKCRLTGRGRQVPRLRAVVKLCIPMDAHTEGEETGKEDASHVPNIVVFDGL